MTTGAEPSGKELDEALARAIRKLIASATEQADTRAAGDKPGAVASAV